MAKFGAPGRVLKAIQTVLLRRLLDLPVSLLPLQGKESQQRDLIDIPGLEPGTSHSIVEIAISKANQGIVPVSDVIENVPSMHRGRRAEEPVAQKFRQHRQVPVQGEKTGVRCVWIHHLSVS